MHLSLARLILILTLCLPSLAVAQLGGGIFTGNGLSSSVLYVNSGANLSNAFRSMRSGMTMFIGPGLYNTPSQQGDWLLTSLGLTNLVNFAIIGSGPGTVLSNNLFGSTIAMERCSNFVMQGFTMIGTRTNNGGATHNTYAGAVMGVATNGYGTFRDVTITNFDTHGISLNGGTPGNPVGPGSIGMRYLNCNFYGIGTTNYNNAGPGTPGVDGVAVNGVSSDTAFHNCRFLGNVRDIEIYDVIDTSSLSISGCYFEATEDAAIWLGHQNNSVKIRGVSIIGNYFSGRTNIAPALFRPFAIRFAGCDGLVIQGNYFSGYAYQIANVSAADYPILNLDVSGNTFFGPYFDGIQLAYDSGLTTRATNVVVRHNNFEFIGRHGLRFAISAGEVSWNRFHLTGLAGGGGVGYGMEVGAAPFVTNVNSIIRENLFRDTASGGIRLETGSRTNYVIRNRMDGAGTVVSDAGVGNSITTFP
jgi:hypothetical protein